MSEFTRRDLVKIAMAVATSGGTIEFASAQHVHQMAADEKAVNGGIYKPKLFNEHEYATLRRLSELIMPGDDAAPSALESGASEFIDLLCSNNNTLAATYTGGIAWMDDAMRRHHNSDFLSATPEQQTALLEMIAYRKNAANSPEMAPGIEFFRWTRMMVVDAYYTSKVGVKAVGYMGNKGMAKFEIPQEAIDYALKRSPV